MNKILFQLMIIFLLFSVLRKPMLACPIGEGSAMFKPVQTPKAFIQKSDGAHSFSLIEPINFAINNNGNIVVIDSQAGQIKVLTLQGKELKYFATQGSLPGQLNHAKGLALDEKNNIFIADTGNHRIQRFDSQGRFIKTWGQWGNGENELNNPTGITVDKQFVYVSDTGNNRIVVFKKNGQFIRSFGAYGQSDEQFNQPLGLATDGYGNVYIADSQNNQIKKYSRNGKFYNAFGTRGHLPGQLATPYGVSIQQGLLTVSELGNHRIQVFKENGEFFRPFSLANWHKSSNVSVVNPADIRVHYPASFATSPNGQFTLACEPQAITCSAFHNGKQLARSVMEDSTRWELGPSNLHYTSAIAVTDGKLQGKIIAVLDAEAHSVAVFHYQNKKTKLISQIGGFGQQAGLFKSPSGIAFSEGGNTLAVSDAHNHRIQLFNVIKNKQSVVTGINFKVSLGAHGRAEGEFNTPTQLYYKGGNLHVLDLYNQRVQIFDKQLKFSQSYPLPSDKNTKISVTDFALMAKSKKIYVNKHEKTLLIVDKNNKIEQKIGERSIKNRKRQMQEDRFKSPSHIAVDNNQNIYITDQADQNIKKFNVHGEYLSAWGQWGSGKLEFYKPKSLAVNKNKIYVVDYGNYRVQILGLNGKYHGEFAMGKRL